MTLSLSQIVATSGTSVREIRQLANEVAGGDHFRTVRVRTPRGWRTVYKADPWLETTLKQLKISLEQLGIYTPPDWVKGFVKKRSTKDNARAHLNAECVLTLDLKDFFESITSENLSHSLRERGIEHQASDLLSDLAAPEGHLAIGFSTSPLYSNLVFDRTDQRLASISRELDLRFTRYVDDLTFSGEIDDGKAEKIKKEITAEGWTISDKKTRFMRRGYSQYVTGLSVSDDLGPHAPRDLKRRMRWRLHVIEKFGLDAYMQEFAGERLGHHPRQLLGLARYIADIEPTLGEAWLNRWRIALGED